VPLNDPLFLAIVSDAELRRVIVEGRKGTPMSAFARENGGALTAEQIESLVSGIRSKWGAATSQPSGPLPAYVSSNRGNASAGAAVFERTCAACHGPGGVGPSKAGPLNVPAFLALVSDQALRRIVITGRPDLGMPDYRHVADGTPHPAALSASEIDDVAALLASWKRTAVAMTQVADSIGAKP
jgi:mono/diheme cytochrome c family protein